MVEAYLNLAMISTEFHKYLSHFEITTKLFDGVFASDKIPNKLKNNHFIICNTDDSSAAGSHWYCFVRNHDCIECFDSLGVDSTKKKFIESLDLYQNSKVYELEYNTSQLQSSDSSSCGKFVICFIVHRLHNKDIIFDDLLNDIFSTDLKKNEVIVKNFFDDHFQNE